MKWIGLVNLGFQKKPTENQIRTFRYAVTSTKYSGAYVIYSDGSIFELTEGGKNSINQSELNKPIPLNASADIQAVDDELTFFTSGDCRQSDKKIEGNIKVRLPGILLATSPIPHFQRIKPAKLNIDAFVTSKLEFKLAEFNGCNVVSDCEIVNASQANGFWVFDLSNEVSRTYLSSFDVQLWPISKCQHFDLADESLDVFIKHDLNWKHGFLGAFSRPADRGARPSVFNLILHKSELPVIGPYLSEYNLKKRFLGNRYNLEIEKTKRSSVSETARFRNSKKRKARKSVRPPIENENLNGHCSQRVICSSLINAGSQLPISKPKIGFVIGNAAVGGSHLINLKQIRLYLQLGFEVTLFLVAEAINLTHFQKGLRIVKLWRCSFKMKFQRIAEFSKQNKCVLHFDVSGFSTQVANLHPNQSLKSNSTKVIFNIFCPEQRPSDGLSGIFATLDNAIHHSDLFLTDSKYGVDLVNLALGSEKVNVTAIRYASKYAHIEKQICNGSNKDKPPTVLWAHRCCYQKQPHLVYQIAKQMKHVTFVMAGHGTIANSQRFEALGNVLPVGDFEDFLQLTKDHEPDLFLNTSLFDGAPNVIKEAISLNIPVVSSACGGIPELFQKGVGLVRVGDVNGFINAITFAISQPTEVMSDAVKYTDAMESSDFSIAIDTLDL